MRRESIFSANEEPINCDRIFYNISNSKINMIICLKIYESELIPSYFVSPQIMFLLYDISNKESFDNLWSFYTKIKNDKNYDNVKFVLLGNKIDLITEEKNTKEEENDEGKSENENNKKENISKNEEELINNNKEYVKKILGDEKFCLVKDISGLTGFGLNELFNDLINDLYINLENIESKIKDINLANDVSNYETDLEVIGKNSYYDKEYKEEIHRINKPKGACCFCSIF